MSRKYKFKWFFQLLLFTCILVFPISKLNAEKETGFFVIGSVNNQTARKLKTFFIKTGDRLTLFPVVVQNGHYYSKCNYFSDEDKQKQSCQSLKIKVKWYQLIPVLRGYDNGSIKNKNPILNIDPVYYRKKPVGAGDEILDFFKIVKKGNYGTYYFTPVIAWHDTKLELSLGENFCEINPLQERNPYLIVQVAYRKDDTYLGYLTELLNAPFILGPRLTPAGVHQTDARVGSDCAAFAIYGKRRQGLKIPYCGPNGIIKYLSEISKSPLYPVSFRNTFVYKDADNKVLEAGVGGLEPGDIVHFAEEVSIFYKDQGILGVLDKDDLIIQSYNNSPYIITIEKGQFYHKPIRVFKWKR